MKTLIIIVFVLAFGALAKSADDDNDTQYITNGLKTRIMGGSDAQVGWFPWQVFIKIKKPFSWSYCGGSLIGSNWALTAAHCVDDALYYKIKVGGIGTTDINEEGSVVATTILRRKHWAYSSRNLNNDIALIKLLSPIPESDTILYLRLPRRSAGSFDGTRATVSGWGQTEHTSYQPTLKYTELNVITNKECEEIYKGMVIKSTLCCRGDFTESTCYGDSGGPLIAIEDDGFPSQIGVVSFISGSSGCSNKQPMGFARVSSHLDWIHGHTGIPIRP